MRPRHWYSLPLSQPDTLFPRPKREGWELRPPVEADRERLAVLMLSAYRGSVDDDGETLEDARQEVNAYFSGREARPLLECSWLCFLNGKLASACLVGWWASRQMPIIAYVMTEAACQRRGLADEVMRAALLSLRAQGFTEVRACITEGNRPSEALHKRLDFVQLLERSRDEES